MGTCFIRFGTDLKRLEALAGSWFSGAPLPLTKLYLGGLGYRFLLNCNGPWHDLGSIGGIWGAPWGGPGDLLYVVVF